MVIFFYNQMNKKFFKSSTPYKFVGSQLKYLNISLLLCA